MSSKTFLRLCQFNSFQHLTQLWHCRILSGIQVPTAIHGSRSQDILLVITLISRRFHSNSFSWDLSSISLQHSFNKRPLTQMIFSNQHLILLHFTSRCVSPIGDTWLCQISRITWHHMAWTQLYPRTWFKMVGHPRILQ